MHRQAWRFVDYDVVDSRPSSFQDLFHVDISFSKHDQSIYDPVPRV